METAKASALPLGEAALVKRAWTLLLVSVAVTLALYWIPFGHYIAYPLMLISTLFHELGHGVAATLMGGNFHDFQMWSDGSGMARHSGDYGAGAVGFIAAGGLCGPAVAAAVAFALARKTKTARLCLAAIGIFMVLAILLVVRNGFGVAFVGVFALACLIIAVYTGEQTAQLALVFLSVQLALSVYSRGDYLFMKEAQTAIGTAPSDTQHMALALGLPYWFWGGLCAAFSAAALVVGSWAFLRSAKRGAATARSDKKIGDQRG
jgi:hypothetical protein